MLDYVSGIDQVDVEVLHPGPPGGPEGGQGLGGVVHPPEQGQDLVRQALDPQGEPPDPQVEEGPGRQPLVATGERPVQLGGSGHFCVGTGDAGT